MTTHVGGSLREDGFLPLLLDSNLSGCRSASNHNCGLLESTAKIRKDFAKNWLLAKRADCFDKFASVVVSAASVGQLLQVALFFVTAMLPSTLLARDRMTAGKMKNNAGDLCSWLFC